MVKLTRAVLAGAFLAACLSVNGLVPGHFRGVVAASSPTVASAQVHVGAASVIRHDSRSRRPVRHSSGPPPSDGLALQGQVGADGAKQIALSGDGSTAIAGAPGDGQVYIYVRSSSGTWSQAAEVSIPSGVSAGFGDSVALNGNGTVAVVGAPNSQAGGESGAGAVYVLTQSSPGTWATSPVEITVTSPTTGANLGSSVAIDQAGDEILAGAPRQSTGAADAGGAYAFQLTSGVWEQTVALQPTSSTQGLVAGIAVGLSADGNTALEGANGSAFVFTRNSGVWGSPVTITNPGSNNAGFGFSAALSADGLHAIVSAPLENVGAIHGAGEVYAFTLSSGVWTQAGSWSDPNPFTDEEFGSENTTAISGDGSNVLIGARSSNTCGTAFLITAVDGAWSTPTTAVPPSCSSSSFFGYGVALSGDGTTALVSADIQPGQTIFAYTVQTPTSIELQSSNQSPTYGDQLTFTATLTSGPQQPPGQVSFVVGSTSLGQAPLNNGIATIRTSGLSAGSDTVTATYTPTDASFEPSSASLVETVNPATLTITCVNASMPYGGQIPALTWMASGFVNGDTTSVLSGTPSCSTGATSKSAPGSYPITLDASSVRATNYDIVGSDGTLTIAPATLTVSGADESMTYGGQVPTVSAVYSGFVNGDTAANSLSGSASCGTTATSSSPVNGSYTTTCTQGTLQNPNGHYVFSFAPGTMVINPAPLSITASSDTIVYGASIPAITPSYAGLVNGDSGPSKAPTCSSTAPSGDAGSYVTYCAGAYDSNYSISYVNGVLTIGPASSTTTLAVSSGSASPTYGQMVRLHVTVGPSAAPGPPAGSVILMDGSTDLGTQPLVNGKASFVVSDFKTGQHSLSAQYMPAKDSEGASDYSSSASAPQSLTVNQAPLTVVAASPTIRYGTRIPAITVSYHGFVLGDGPSSLTTQPVCTASAGRAGQIPPAGSYQTACSGAQAVNYSISYQSGVLVVRPAPLTIIAGSRTITYGSPTPQVPALYRGFVNGENRFSLTSQPLCRVSGLPAGKVAPAGSYHTVCAGATDTNYTISYKIGTLAVHRAPLAIRAENQSAVFGDRLPNLSWTANFVGGDTARSLNRAPACTTIALVDSRREVTSPAGRYSISCHGAADPNYLIAYESGTLRVFREDVTLTYQGDTSTIRGGVVQLAAALKSDGIQPVSGRVLTLGLGTGANRQSCITEATNPAGNAGCRIQTVEAPAGKQMVTMSFAGDPPGSRADYLPGGGTTSIEVRAAATSPFCCVGRLGRASPHPGKGTPGI